MVMTKEEIEAERQAAWKEFNDATHAELEKYLAATQPHRDTWEAFAAPHRERLFRRLAAISEVE